MQLTEELKSDIIEKLLDELEGKNKPEIPETKCRHCKKEMTIEVVQDGVCSCGAEPPSLPVLPMMKFLDIKMRKSIYKPVTYGRAIILSAMGAFLPINEPKFTSLLCVQQIPSLLHKLQKMQESLSIVSNEIDVEKTRFLLKQINKGCYYRYACFLTSLLNKTFTPLTIRPVEMDQILVRYRALARTFAIKKDIFNRKFTSKRKSLPYVPVILRVIFEKLGFEHLARDLPRMRSKKREQKIRILAEYLYNESNFLVSQYQKDRNAH